jgi:hypothetical protein
MKTKPSKKRSASKKRGRPTSYAFASNRHQRPLGKLLFPDSASTQEQAAQIRKISAQLEVSNAAPQTVANNQ